PYNSRKIDMRTQMTTQDYDLDHLETILKENKSDLTKAKHTIKGLESRVAVLTGGMDTKERELRSALEAARDVISELESTNAAQRANSEHLDQARAAAEAARQVLTDELAQLKHQLSDRASASAKHQATI